MKTAPLVLGLIFAIVVDTAIQLLWKYAADQLPSDGSIVATFSAAIVQPMFLLVGILYIVQLCNWLFVMEHADLSFAQPITSVSYATVGLASMVFFHEPATVTKLCGVGLILIGTWFISRSGALTQDRT